MPEPRYTYKVRHDSGTRMEWEFSSVNAKEALGHFNSGLNGVGHSDRRFDAIQYDLLVAMTEGKDGITVLDPDYNGQMSFTRIATT